MITLLIADDSKIIRRGLEKSVEWKKYGIDNVITAENGDEALKLIQTVKVDIMITDIRMPKTDGIAVCEYCHNHKIPVKIVILSGYDDFAYAQQAIRFGVRNYLLKPMRIEDVSATVQKLAEEVSSESDKTNQSFLVYLNNVINRRIVAPMEHEAYKYIKKKEAPLRTAVFKPRVNELSSWSVPADFSVIKFGIMNILTEAFDKDKAEVFEDNIGNVVVLIYCDGSSYEMIKLVIDEITEKIEEGIELSVAVGIGDECENVTGLYQSYRSALDQIDGMGFDSIAAMQSNAIRNAKIYIDEHLGDDVQLNTVANYVYLSPNYFSTYFKKETGKRFSEYVIERKLIKAKKLLWNRDMKIYEVAEQLGYDNPRYFSDFFKKHTGLTAKEFQSMYSKKPKDGMAEDE